MFVVIRFSTALFDVTKERPNPINPIFGESLLLWLRQALAPAHNLAVPEAEDWGWYSGLAWQGQQFMIGASASEEENGQREWLLQVVPQRTFMERMLGRGKVWQGHPLVAHLAKVLSAELAFKGVTVESSA